MKAQNSYSLTSYQCLGREAHAIYLNHIFHTYVLLSISRIQTTNFCHFEIKINMVCSVSAMRVSNIWALQDERISFQLLPEMKTTVGSLVSPPSFSSCWQSYMFPVSFSFSLRLVNKMHTKQLSRSIPLHQTNTVYLCLDSWYRRQFENVQNRKHS